MTDEELAELEAVVAAERERRRVEAERAAERERLLASVEDYQVSLGRSGGDPWERPATVLESYPCGAVVTHGGSLHESLNQMNMAEPGTDPNAWSAV